eukprot:sb/3461150/
MNLDLKSLILESIHKGQLSGSPNEQKYLLFTIPFVCSILRSVLGSRVFSPPNAWTMGLLGLLMEVHDIPDLKISLKFETELLLKDLHMEVSDVTVKGILQCDNLKEKYKMEQLVSLAPPKPAPMMMGPNSYTPSPLGPGTPPQQPQQAPAPNMPVMAPPPGPTEADYTKIRINTNLAIFQKRPELTHCVQSAIESAINKLGRVVVDKAISMTISTAEHIIKKDFALDPEESKMRLAAQFMVRHIAAAAVLIYAREQLSTTIKENLLNNLLKNFLPNMNNNMGPPIDIELAMCQDADNAAKVVAADNLDLACMRLQADAVRLAFKEIDKRLEKEYRKRFDCRKEGQRFSNPVVAQVQETLPEQLKLQPTGCTKQQFEVYQQFGKNIPACLPMPSAAPTIPSINSQFPIHHDKWSGLDQGHPEMDLTGASSGAPPGGDMGQFGGDLNRNNALLNNRMQSFFGGGFGGGQGGGERTIDDLSRMVMYKQQQQQQQFNQHMTPSYQTDELTRLLTELYTKLESLLHQFPLQSYLRPTLDKLLKTIKSAQYNSADSIRLIGFSVEGILDCHRPEVLEKEQDKAKVLCDSQLVILKVLAQSNVFGPQVLQKHSTKAVIDAKEDIKYNEHAIDLLIKHNLILMKEFCSHLAHILHERINMPNIPHSRLLDSSPFFKLQLKLGVHLCNKAKGGEGPVREEDIRQLKEVLRYYVHKSSDNRGGPGGPAAGGPGGEDDGKMREEATTQVKIILQQWFALCHKPDEHMVQFLTTLQQYINEETLALLFKVYMEYITDVNFKNHLTNKEYMYKTREDVYNCVDSFVRLVFLMMRNNGDWQYKMKLLQIVLLTVKQVLHKDHETKKTQFLVLPYQRFFVILFQEVTAEPMAPEKLHKILQLFCQVYHLIQPNVVPGFTCAWLELISHRHFLHKILSTENKSQPGPGWPLYHQLLIDLFLFLYPFLRNAELVTKNETLYKGTLRCLLVLLHDFPEFLCDYHFPFCDVIPPGCLQLRNIILSAFPSNKSLPDPFSKDLKVDQLESIKVSPRLSYDYTAAIPPSFKKDLDSYLQSRTPVTFLVELQKNIRAPTEDMPRGFGGDVLAKLETGSKYNIRLMNSLVLYVGVQAINSAQRCPPTQTTIAQGAHMDIFQNLAVDLDNEGRYLFLNAICNQLRYPNTHTHYFSCTLLHLFAEGNSDKLREQITRILLERLCAHRPHPWGLLITFIELIKNHDYRFWDHEFVRCAPEIENLFKSVFSNLQSKNATLNNREDGDQLLVQ